MFGAGVATVLLALMALSFEATSEKLSSVVAEVVPPVPVHCMAERMFPLSGRGGRRFEFEYVSEGVRKEVFG